jgi:hypothetical protein
MMLRLKATCLAQMFCKRERREEVGEYGLEYAKRAASRLSPPAYRTLQAYRLPSC